MTDAPRPADPLTEEDLRFLRWCHERFAVVFHESPNLDWMQRLAALGDATRAPRPADPLTPEQIGKLARTLGYYLDMESDKPALNLPSIAERVVWDLIEDPEWLATLDATRAPRSDDALRAALARAEAIDTLDYYEDSGSDSFNYDRYREDVVRAATAPPSPDEWTDPKG